MRQNEVFDIMVKEHVDIFDNKTRKVILALDEADQNQVLNNLTSKLYDLIIEKIDDIDYGMIPESKGDITALSNYDTLLESIDVIRKLLVEYKQDTKPVDTIQTALSNIVDRKETFEKGFRYNIEFAMVTYCTLTLSVISAVSFLISTCVEFIKNANSDSFEIVLDKTALIKSKNNLLFTNLDKFNKSVSKGEFDKAMDFIVNNKVKQFAGFSTATMIVGGVALGIIALNILPILRELIFFFYYSRTRVADYFEIQAELLELNAYNVNNNPNLSKNEKKTIYNKQTKIASKFRSIANFFAVQLKKAEVESEKEMKKPNKKYKIDEITDKESLPDSAAAQATSSSLF